MSLYPMSEAQYDLWCLITRIDREGCPNCLETGHPTPRAFLNRYLTQENDVEILTAIECRRCQITWDMK